MFDIYSRQCLSLDIILPSPALSPLGSPGFYSEFADKHYFKKRGAGVGTVTSETRERERERERESVIIPPPDSPLISQRFSEGGEVGWAARGFLSPQPGPSACITRGKLARLLPSPPRHFPIFCSIFSQLFIFRYQSWSGLAWRGVV